MIPLARTLATLSLVLLTATIANASFHAGASAFFLGGEDYTNSLGFAGRAGYLFKDMHSVEVEVNVFYDDGERDLGDYEGYLVPAFLQYRFMPRIREVFRPYVGAGIGYAWVTEEGSAPVIGEYDETETSLAWQGFVGVFYEATDEWMVQVGYRYLEIDDLTIAGIPTREEAGHVFELGAHYRF